MTKCVCEFELAAHAGSWLESNYYTVTVLDTVFTESRRVATTIYMRNVPTPLGLA